MSTYEIIFVLVVSIPVAGMMFKWLYDMIKCGTGSPAGYTLVVSFIIIAGFNVSGIYWVEHEDEVQVIEQPRQDLCSDQGKLDAK